MLIVTASHGPSQGARVPGGIGLVLGWRTLGGERVDWTVLVGGRVQHVPARDVVALSVRVGS